MLRRIARPLLASVFVVDGLRAALRPREEIENLPRAEEALGRVAEQIPVPVSPDLLVRALGVAKAGAGVALGLGVAPRAAASLLAVLHTPTMLARNPFWTETGAARREAIGGLVRDAAILGGLLLASGDTAGKPSLAWRAEAARHDTAKAAKHATREARDRTERATKAVITSAERDVAKLEATIERTARRKTRDARKAAKRIERDLRAAVKDVEHTVGGVVGDVVDGAREKIAAR